MRFRSRFPNPVWVLLTIILFSGRGLPQAIEKTTPNPLKSFVATVGGDILHVASSPLRMSKDDALRLTSFTLMSAGIAYGFDQPVHEEFVLERHSLYTQSSGGFVKLGELYDEVGSKNIALGLSAGMIGSGLIFNDKKLLETSRLMIESFVIAGAITTLGKHVLGRARPYTGRGPYDLNALQFRGGEDFLSLPSGHATSAFAMMTVIAKQYPQWWIKIPAYTLAASVALQRIDSRNHWPSDVFVGGVIGYWVGSMLVNHTREKSGKILLDPYFAANRAGVRIRF